MGCPEIQYVSSTLSSFPTCFKIIKIILPPPHIILNIPMALWPHQVKWSFILLTNPPCFVGEGFLANPAWWASRHGQTRAWHLAPPVFTNSWMDQNPELAGWWFRGTPTWQLGKLHVFFPCFFFIWKDSWGSTGEATLPCFRTSSWIDFGWYLLYLAMETFYIEHL